jgi:hypothetical protein
VKKRKEKFNGYTDSSEIVDGTSPQNVEKLAKFHSDRIMQKAKSQNIMNA